MHEHTTKLTPLKHLTTVKPAFHYITKAPKSTHQVSSSTVSNEKVDVDAQPSVKLKIIVPTTYAPKYLRKTILSNSPVVSSSLFSFRPKNQSRYKTLKAVRKLINPVKLNHELTNAKGTTYEAAEDIVANLEEQPLDSKDAYQVANYTSTTSTTPLPPTATTPESRTTTTTKRILDADAEHLKNRLYALLSKEKLKATSDTDNQKKTSEKRFNLTVEIPTAQDILSNEDTQKPEPDQPPSYKPSPPSFPPKDLKTTESPITTSYPARVSRVNAAIKSLIAIGGTKGPSKCSNKGPKCKVEAKQQRYLSFVLILQINLHGTAPIFLIFAPLNPIS